MLAIVALGALASVSPLDAGRQWVSKAAPGALDPLSLLGDNKAAQKTKLNAYVPLPGCEMATLAMS